MMKSTNDDEGEEQNDARSNIPLPAEQEDALSSTSEAATSLSPFVSINHGQPGAVAVSGTTGSQSRRDRNYSTAAAYSVDCDTVFTTNPREAAAAITTRGREAAAEESDDDVLVNAETVDNDAIMAQAVSAVISKAAQAEVVANGVTDNKRRKNFLMMLSWLIVSVALVVVGVSFGITLSSSNDRRTANDTQQQQENQSQQIILAQINASDPDSLDFFSAQAMVSVILYKFSTMLLINYVSQRRNET